jgi:uncharacterized protein YfaS (alpha-2-macroglobulin family)
MANPLWQFIKKYRVLLGVLLIALSGAVVVRLITTSSDSGGPSDDVNPPLMNTTTDDSGVSEVAFTSMNGEGELLIRLSEGQPQPQDEEPVPVATGEPLTEEEIEAILARLPSLVIEPDDQVELNLPDESLPPPRTGETIEVLFPPPTEISGPEPVEPGPLEVVRYAPEGEIPLAPFINITFNQPMVPLATLSQLSAMDVPVVLEPALTGTWRWVGTKTLTFEYDSTEIDRLPKATEYQVTIPAGTISTTGGVLAEDVSWSFSTPPPTMISHYPSYDPQPLDPLFFIAFDQRIDPQAVLETIEVKADNKDVEIKLASEEDIQEDARVSGLAKNTGESRWLAFKAKESLPADASIVVQIGPGTPSAEGPLVTEQAQSFNFRTYAPLRIDDYGCSWNYNDNCPPLSPFYIRFNNPIDIDIYEDSMLTIQPEIPGATINIFGNTLNIRGSTQGSTTYKVTVREDIQDTFGQKLGKDVKLTFRVGTAEPFLVGPDKILVTLDPALPKPVFSVYSLNFNKLDVKVYAVEPFDWLTFKTYLEDYYREDPPPDPPGKLVLDETMRVEAPSDTLVQVDIDLSQVMDNEYGHFIVKVEPTRSLLDLDRDRYRYLVQSWVQVTDIGLDAFVDHSEMVVWTTDLQDGSPLSQVSIEAVPTGKKVSTGEDGTVRFPLPDTNTVNVLTAQCGEDTAILPESTYYWSDSGWSPRNVKDELRWYIFDDRQMYRPGEEVHVKGWIRRVGGKQDGDVGLVGNIVTAVQYTVTGPQGNTFEEGQADVNALGGFDFVLSLPENANLGYAQIHLSAMGSVSGMNSVSQYHSFQIQEFRRPEFEVKTRNETSGPYFVGEDATVAVEATYYAGGPLPNAEVNWLVTSSPSNYEPPNWPDFVFGTWTPWWYRGPIYVEEVYSPYYPGAEGGEVQTFSGVTDATGNHYLRLDFDEAKGPRPYSVTAEATVFDVNRQAWASATNLLVHPANLYVGMRSERTFVQRGTPLEIDLIVTDLDGNPVPDRPIQVQAARLEWKYTRGSWNEEEADVQNCNVGSTLEPVTCTFETDIGGRYKITARVTDDLGRVNQSEMTRWVSGGQLPPSREVEKETVTLIPDQETYQPDDVANILVQAPFSPAEGQLIVSRSGILYTERFQMDEDTITLQVPIEEAYIPNLHVQVDLVGNAPRTDDEGEILPDVPPRPAYASGELNLSIPPLQRTLSLEVDPLETELEPGGETTIDLTLKDADGNPVPGAELAVVVVDEAILALTNYQMTDPISIFYQARPSDLSSTYGRSSIVLADPQALTEAAASGSEHARDAVEEKEAGLMATLTPALPMEAPSADTFGEAGTEPSPIRVRTDFNPLATFAPEVRTDVNGEARVEVSLPDNLTRYRIMVVAVDDGNQFGMGEANMVARLPLMVRPSAPRFLNFGDSFQLPIVLQNQTEESLPVEVVIQAGNVEVESISGLRVDVPANDRLEVRFPVSTVKAGTARFQIAAVSGSYADAAAVELPVYTPATTEAFAVYGVIDEGAIVQPITSPQDVYSQFGGLEINTSSTALQALTDAVLYLTNYRFECSEQLASRILGIAALRDVLTAFSAEGLPSPEEMEAAVIRDIERLESMQNNDGGFPYWTRGRDSIPFNTIHVAHALYRAELMDFEVPQSMRESVLEYLRFIENHYPSWYTKRTRDTLSAYALYVRDLMGDQDLDKARRLLNETGLEDLTLEAVGWIWQVLIDDPGSTSELEAIRRHVNNRAVETAGAANFTTSYTDQAYLLLRSDRRVDAILLDALMSDNPDSDLIPKIVNGLLAHREQGRWRNTQENVFILLALDKYFKTYEAQTPDFVARIWLGETYAGSHEFIGRTTDREETNIPMLYLVDDTFGDDEMQNLIVEKDGTGRLYYRLGLSYAPRDLNLEPMDMGFVVQRIYEAVDDPEDVSRDENGVWHIKAGTRVRVRLTMVADNRRYHVALVDPLPAGLEIINPSLAVSGSIPQDPNSSDYRYGWWWWWPWYEHQNMRDERAEAFASLLWEGVYNYSYVARATTPGTFIVPPTKAEEMYSPEVFGRSGSDWVIVE